MPVRHRTAESKSIINCRWPNKLDNVVGSRLDVDEYIIVLHIPATTHRLHLHVAGGSVGGSVKLSVILVHN